MLYVDNVRLYTGPTEADNTHETDAGRCIPPNCLLTRVKPTKGPQNRAELLALYRHDNNDGTGRPPPVPVRV